MKREIAVINEKKRVVQGNPLLKISYSMPQLPARIMRMIIAQFDDQRDKEFPQLSFSKKEMGEALGLTSHEKISENLRDALSLLRNKEIEFLQNPGTKEEAIVSTGWILKSRVFNYKDRVDIWMDGDLAPFLLDLKKRFYDEGQTFSKYRLEEVLSFRGDYSIRFFEWFNEYRWKEGKSKSGKWYIPEIPIEEIRRRLGHLDEKGNIIKLERWPDFRRYVIEAATEEISDKSDFTVDWEVTKKGKKVVGIVFHCTPKDKKHEQEQVKLMQYQGTARKDEVVEGLAQKEFEKLPWKKEK